MKSWYISCISLTGLKTGKYKIKVLANLVTGEDLLPHQMGEGKAALLGYVFKSTNPIHEGPVKGHTPWYHDHSMQSKWWSVIRKFKLIKRVTAAYLEISDALG